jgi:integrase
MNKKPKGVFERPSGSGIWWIRYSFEDPKDGRVRYYRNKIGLKEDAIDRYYEVKNEIKKGIHQPKTRSKVKDDLRNLSDRWGKISPQTQPHTKTLKELIDQYMETTVRDLHNKRAYRRFWNLVLGDEGVDEIKLSTLQSLQKELMQYKDKKNKNKSSGVIDHYFIFLKSVFKSAVQNGEEIKNPFIGFKLLKHPNPPVTIPTDDDLKKIKKHMTADNWNIIKLFMLTGMRRGELFPIRWENVDLQNKMITIPFSKSGKNRIVYLNDEASEIVDTLPSKGQSSWLFPSKVLEGSINADHFHKEVWKVACNKAGLKFRIHDLRHFFVTHLLMQGADLKAVQELAGHLSIETTLKYSHLTKEHLFQAVNKLNAKTEKKN